MSKHYSNLLAFFILFFIIYACSSDSSEDDLSSLPPNEVGPQYIKENDSIIDFLKNHFYNYEDFQNLSPSAQIELKIDSITGDNSNKIALFEQVTTKSIDILDENDEIVSHNLYYIITRPAKIQLLLIQCLFHIKESYLIIQYLMKDKILYGWIKHQLLEGFKSLLQF